MMAFALQQVFQAAVSGFKNFLNVSLLILYFLPLEICQVGI